MTKVKNDLSFEFAADKFYFVPLGGSEQFGVNCNLYVHDNSWLLVDLGMGFAGDKTPGVDILLPDIDCLAANKGKLDGLVITHAHEDHIGAVPYLWPRLRCPIFCTPFTAEVLRQKFREYPDCDDAVITEINAGDNHSIGAFDIDYVHMAHSIPDTVSLFIQTPAGNAFHSADWNLDPSPVIGKTTDMSSLKTIGRKGVDVYIGDSTNAMVSGRAGSEQAVEEGLHNVLEGCEGKVVITLFASNVGRIQSICRAARENDRSVAVLGRSLHKMIACARSSGYLKDIPDFVAEEDMDLIPDDNLVVIATGSQGEARAAMARIARGDWQGLSLKENDTVIFSSREIPGNEKDIDQVKNNLVASGVRIIDPDNAAHKIHVSGHPYRDEIYDMLSIIKPNAVIPIHGEYIQLSGQAEVAKGCGIQNIQIPSNGSVIQIDKDGLKVQGYVPTGLLAVEPKRVIKIDHRAIRERRKIQYAGVVHVTVVLDKNGNMYDDPQITTLGLIDDKRPEDMKLEDDLFDEICEIHEDMSLEEHLDDDFVAEQIRIGVRRFMKQALGFKPVTNVHLVRV